MIEHRVGGIILVPVSGSEQKLIEHLQKFDIPIVLAVRELPEINSDYVGVDYNLGTQLAINHLIDKGHKRIAYIGGPNENITWKERMKGYHLAHTSRGLTVDESIVLPCSPTKKAGLETVQEMLKRSGDDLPTAIFCYTDLVAFGVFLGLRNVGITPGKDIDIVGFDNVPESEIVTLTNNSFFLFQINRCGSRKTFEKANCKQEYRTEEGYNKTGTNRAWFFHINYGDFRMLSHGWL